MKRRNKKVDGRIERAYGRACSGIAIHILDIPKVFAVGVKTIEAGADDAALEAALRAYVETIRVAA